MGFFSKLKKNIAEEMKAKAEMDKEFMESVVNNPSLKYDYDVNKKFMSKAEKENIIKEGKELEQRREIAITERKEIEKEQIDLWNQNLKDIPLYEIEIGKPFDKLEYPEEYDIKYSSVTKRSNRAKLGNFVVIDTETTGLRKTSSILELSAIRYRDFEPVEKFETFVKPNIKKWEEAQAVNGISPEMVENSPKIKDVAASFIDFVGDDNIVGHNLPFDIGVLESKGICFLGKRKFYDNLSIAQKHLVKAKSKKDEYGCYYYYNDYDVEDHKLDTLVDYYGIYRDNAHRSDSDCMATAIIFEKMINEIVEE